MTSRKFSLGCIMFAVCILSGCEGGLHQAMRLPGIPSAADLREQTRTAAEHRRRFKETGDPKSIRWLLAHRVQEGMSVEEVDRVLGVDGKRRYEDASFKAHNRGVRATDATYEWGPDSKGSPYLLFFRNDRLINHRPERYADDADDSADWSE